MLLVVHRCYDDYIPPRRRRHHYHHIIIKGQIKISLSIDWILYGIGQSNVSSIA